MLKNGCKFALAATVLFIAACSSSYNPFYKSSARLPSRNQLCTQLRHQIIFQNGPTNAGTNSMGTSYPNDTPTHQASMMKEYQRYDCEQFEQ